MEEGRRLGFPATTTFALIVTRMPAQFDVKREVHWKLYCFFARMLSVPVVLSVIGAEGGKARPL